LEENNDIVTTNTTRWLEKQRMSPDPNGPPQAMADYAELLTELKIELGCQVPQRIQKRCLV